MPPATPTGIASTASQASGTESSRPVGPPSTRPRNLRQFGYLDYDTDPTDARRGVTMFDSARACAGYSLYSVQKACRADLIDLKGTVVRSWSHPGKHWSNCDLLENGDLLVVGSDAPAADKPRGDEETNAYVLRMSWSGEVVWKLRMPAHHDAEYAPGGELLTLIRRLRSIPEIDVKRRIKDSVLMRFSADRQPIDELSLLDVLRDARYRFREVAPTGASIDLLHANSIEWMRDPALAARHAIYASGNVLVCTRHQDAVFIVDWERKKLVWSWGPGEISGPHDATVLPSGNILIFDNGLERDWSRVVELDPIAQRIVWQYQAATPTDFYTASRGSNQRLPNGNTLIAESDRGRAFEVTPGGDIVWEFFTPHANADGRRMAIVRFKRYPAEWVERLIAAGIKGG